MRRRLAGDASATKSASRRRHVCDIAHRNASATSRSLAGDASVSRRRRVGNKIGVASTTRLRHCASERIGNESESRVGDAVLLRSVGNESRLTQTERGALRASRMRPKVWKSTVVLTLGAAPPHTRPNRNVLDFLTRAKQRAWRCRIWFEYDR
jgi:hypothetical protein